MSKNIRAFLIVFCIILCTTLLSCATDQVTTPTPTAPTETSIATSTPATPSETTTAPDTTGELLGYTIEYLVGTPQGGTISGQASQMLPEGQYTSEVEAIPAFGFKFSHWNYGK